MMRLSFRWRRFVAAIANTRPAEKVFLVVITTVLLWATAVTYVVYQIAQGRHAPVLWPPVPSRLREARQLLEPFRPLLDDHAALRQKSRNPAWAVAEQCRWPLDVLFLVHTVPGRRQRRAFLRTTLLEHRLVRYFNWTGAFFTHDRANGSSEHTKLALEVAQEGDLVDVSPYLTSVDVARSRHRRDVRDAQVTLEALRWAFRNCRRVRYVVEVSDGIIPRDPLMFVRYLRDYVNPERRILACRPVRKKRRGVLRAKSSKRTRMWSSHTTPTSPRVVRYCAGSPVSEQTTRAVRVLTGQALRGLYLESLVPGPRLVDGAYVTGDLALAAGVVHVDFAEAGEDYVKRDGRILNYTATFTKIRRDMATYRNLWWYWMRKNMPIYEQAFGESLRITLPLLYDA
ncbi:hypothetical protein HPB52_004173 [Rhipicephalus sanguineus]|uniref:Uncharacterized protein n=1 Tax=Rhipicephalus sanguineus TaxID=34632 RepID=A0A9D4T2S9_RHISA|nr:hypothetical protein HPB52_004173 [Rhipicephalus sanguineus]